MLKLGSYWPWQTVSSHFICQTTSVVASYGPRFYCIFVSLFIILGQTDADLDHEQCVNLIPRKPWGRAVLLGGEGQGVLMFLLSKTVAMLIEWVLFRKTCNRTFFVICLISHWTSKRWTLLARDLPFLVHWVLSEYSYFTAFAVHYDKIRNHLLEEATNSAKIHSLARKYQHLRIN